VVLAAGVVSDDANSDFWVHHALLAGLVASLIVVALSAAVLNEVLERRRRQRWSVLAQYVMFELVRNARMIWSGVLEVAGSSPAASDRQQSLEAGAQLVRDTARLTAVLRNLLDDDDGRARLRAEISFLSDHCDEVLGRWAAVMLNTEFYAEIIDRHVELAGDIAWIGDMLDSAHPPEDPQRLKRARSTAATQIWNADEPVWLADRLVVIVQLAEALDHGTLELAMQIVPVQWWEERLGSATPPDTGSSEREASAQG
jgi:hypothetical protein